MVGDRVMEQEARPLHSKNDDKYSSKEKDSILVTV
jgi:hypothetical protein